MTLNVQVVRADGVRTIIALRGEADWSTTAILSDALSRVIASHTGDVVVDLGQLDFIDTATARIIATAHHLIAAQGRTMSVHSPSRLAARVLDMFGLVELVEAPNASSCELVTTTGGVG